MVLRLRCRDRDNVAPQVRDSAVAVVEARQTLTPELLAMLLRMVRMVRIRPMLAQQLDLAVVDGARGIQWMVER